MSYETYRILLDEPAPLPGLGFPAYADAFADIITASQPRFAIGVFGGWGSGKTTLMRAIEERLNDRPDIVTIWFNAWRFEHEGNMIVPLIDVLRAALYRLAKSAPEPRRRERARVAADRIARAGRALLASITVRAAIPGLNIELDGSKVTDALEPDTPGGQEDLPLSFYQAGFTMLADAISEFADRGADRIVIFIDDLDRCLPAKALEVLESMKVFFDTAGIVFVVGLDRTVVEQAVRAKFGLAATAGSSSVQSVEYIKKIFQVPFALPRITTGMLTDYLDHIAASGELSPPQQADFDENVRPHLAFLTGDETVNPREVKRLINAYTIQLRMLSGRMSHLNPEVVLAFQCLSFRSDWEDLYERLLADPALFQQAIKDARSDPRNFDMVWLGGERVPVPPSFRAYLAGRGGILITAPSLEQYVVAVEATRSADPGILETHIILGRLRRELGNLETADLSWDDQSDLIEPPQIDDEIRRLFDTVERHSQRYPVELSAASRQLTVLRREFPKRRRNQEPDQYRGEVSRWVADTTPVLDVIDSVLRELRRSATVGASHDPLGP